MDGGHNQEKDVLHLGCGNNLIAGAVNVDLRAGVGADVVHDLNRRPWPFPDNRFGAVIATHVIEHLHDTVAVMDEIHRVCRDGATVKIVTPHFSSPNAFTDPPLRLSAELLAFLNEGQQYLLLREWHMLSVNLPRSTNLAWAEAAGEGVTRNACS